jgi:hypothetical protein
MSHETFHDWDTQSLLISAVRNGLQKDIAMLMSREQLIQVNYKIWKLHQREEQQEREDE